MHGVNKGQKDGFIKAVKKQIDLYKGLEEVIKSEQAALKSKDINAMDGIVKKEEAAIKEIKKLEDEKLGIFGKMAADAGLKADEGAKLRDVLLKCGKDDALEIESAVACLMDVVRRVDAVNAGNARLLRDYVEYVEFMKMTKEKINNPVQTTYTPDGAKKTEPVKNGPKIDHTI